MAPEKTSVLEQFPHLSDAEKLQLQQLLAQDGQIPPTPTSPPSFADVFGTKASPLKITSDPAAAGQLVRSAKGEVTIDGMALHSQVRLITGAEGPVRFRNGKILDPAGTVIDPSKIAAFRNAAEGAKWIDVKRPPSAPEIPHYENEVAGGGVAIAKNPKAVPEDVLSRTTRKGNRFLDAKDAARTVFVDYGSKLQTPQGFDGHAVRSMVAVAEARGWHSIKVSGSEDFRRAVFMEAASRGLEVSGYKPTEAEKSAAEKAATTNGHANKIEENPMVKAYRSAETPEDRRAAAKRHPNLKNAYALEAALSRFAEQRLQPGARDAFIERSKQNIAADLASGVSFNEVLVRKEQANRPARARELQSEQSR